MALLSILDRGVGMQEYFNVGKIVNTHGIKGEVRVISSTDFPEKRFQKGTTLFIFLKDSKAPIEVTVQSWRKHKNFDLLMFEGYETLNDVEKFKGGILKVAKEQLEELGEDEFYFHEIIGCKVKTEDGEEIGIIKEILTPGANDVWVVKGKNGKEYYIPYIKDVVKKVDVENKLVWIEAMEGLLD